MVIQVLLTCAVFCVISCHPDMRVVDLTHAHSSKSIMWPGSPDYNFTILTRRQIEQFWYESNYFGTAEHGGTHADAPAHFSEGAWRTQQIPMENLIGQGVVINVKAKAAQNPDYRVTVADLEAWETKHNTRIPNGAVVLMNSGWSPKHPNKTLVFGTETPNDTLTLHFPGIHEDAATWLADQRSVHVVGVDTPSVDYGQSTDFKCHVIFAKAGIIGAENVANLDQLPEIGSMVYVAVVKLFDGSGGPARVFATYYESSIDATIKTHGETVCYTLMFTLAIFSYIFFLISFFLESVN